MKLCVRYCDTGFQKGASCDVGWGTIDTGGYKSCHDEPVTQNCRNLIDLNHLTACPFDDCFHIRLDDPRVIKVDEHLGISA